MAKINKMKSKFSYKSYRFWFDTIYNQYLGQNEPAGFLKHADIHQNAMKTNHYSRFLQFLLLSGC